MALPSIPVAAADLLQVRIAAYQAPQAAYNVLHYGILSIVGGTLDLQALCTAFEAHLSAFYKDCISEDATYYGIGMKRISPGVPTPEVIAQAGLGVGTWAGDSYAKQVAGLITKQTVKAGRAYRGRVYVPFVSEAASENDTTPTAAYLTALSDLASKILAPVTLAPPGITSVTLEPYLYHRASGLADKVVNYIVRQFWATQRRRGDYGQTDPVPFAT